MPFPKDLAKNAQFGRDTTQRLDSLNATLQAGNSPDDYENALSRAVLFLERNATFLARFH